MVHVVVGTTVETHGDSGFKISITQWHDHGAAIAFAQRMASICGGEVIIADPVLA